MHKILNYILIKKWNFFYGKIRKNKNTYTKTDIEDSYMNIEKYIFKRKYERNNDILRINNR